MAAYGAFTVVCSFIIFGIIKKTMGLRVTEEEELEGLDAGEHGMSAYDMGTGSAHAEARMATESAEPVMSAAPATV